MGTLHPAYSHLTADYRCPPFQITADYRLQSRLHQITGVPHFCRLQQITDYSPDYRCPPFLQITADYSRLQITVQITGVPLFADYIRLQGVSNRLQLSPLQITDYTLHLTDYRCPPIFRQITPYTRLQDWCPPKQQITPYSRLQMSPKTLIDDSAADRHPRVMNTEATAAGHPSGFGPGEDITLKLARLVHPYLSEAPARQTPAGGKQPVVLRHVRVLEHSGGGD